MRTLTALALVSVLLCCGCSQVTSMVALDVVNQEVEICRSDYLNALDLTPENETKLRALEKLYKDAKEERAAVYKDYVERAEKLREETWNGWKTAAMWAERVGILAVLLPMI